MILDILRHTPLWVFAILAALVLLGLQRMRARDLTTRQLFILPAAMAVLSAFGLWQSFGASLMALGGWIAAIVVALLVGRMLPLQDGVQYSPATRRIHVPGSWVPLVLMMTIFFLRYVAAVSLAIQPALHADTAFAAAIGLAYGLSTGVFAARALRTWNSAFRRHDTIAAVATAA